MLRKPLIIRGARQTGETWLMRELGGTEYKNVAYINFESDARGTFFVTDQRESSSAGSQGS